MISWGVVQINGQTFKDVMLAPGICKEWDWRASGTSHSKGPQKQDIDLLVATGELDYFILTRGMDFKLSISGSILEYVMLKVPNVIICGSEDVMDHYNDLVAKGERVAALIHSTC